MRGWLIWLLVLAAIALAGIVWWQTSRAHFSLSVAGNYLAAREAYERGDSALAMRLYQQALYVAPNDVRLQIGAFLSYLRENRRAAALHLAPMLYHHPDYHRYAHLLLLNEDIRRGRWARAEQRLADFGDTRLEETLHHAYGGWLAWQRKDEAELARHRAGLRAVRGMRALGWWQEALLAEYAGATEEASEQYRKGWRTGGAGMPAYAQAWARFLHRQGNATKAREILRDYTDRYGAHPFVELARKELDAPPAPLSLGPATALADFLAALSGVFVPQLRRERLLYAQLGLLLHGAPQLHFVLAERYAQYGYWEKAAEHYSEIEKTAPYYAAAQLRRAGLLHRHGATEAALSALTPLREGEMRVAVLSAIAEIHREREEFADAEKVYDELLEGAARDASPWELYFARGIVRERQNKWELAEKDLLLARRLSGDEPHVLNYLGYSWVDQGIQLRRAFAMIQQAVQRQPDNGAFIDSLGWAHFRLGDFPRAVMHLERAVELEPMDPIITDHFGDALWYAGRRDEARHQWRRALLLEPSAKLQTSLEQKLENDRPRRYNLTSSNL